MTIVTIFTRLGLALIIGIFLGYEPNRRQAGAGLRTHILVALSMTIVALIQISLNQYMVGLAISDPEHAFLFGIDIARLTSQALAGMGFIGAGMILHQENTIVGLTAAASVWSVAVVGLAIGMGFYLLSIISALFIFTTLYVVTYYQTRLNNRFYNVQLDISFKKSDHVLEELLAFMKRNNLIISRVEYLDSFVKLQDQVRYYLQVPENKDIKQIKKEIYYIHPAITFVEYYSGKETPKKSN
ncbi:MgtC/SapB family protein [Jeotgalibaca sp. MA1X17-3]|uniref:MgtC/SapB family protein n=1 Tax=Jeotgalibaca sp. MA1X17-3 TaxID=2908211 RepID=UPI001F1FCE37|nr:MgtC/SapB family protein [Jeotgalibaca sp. MA1X17-3]UJF15284.1 MgtC/SapB family protein [Jeotgalibaca sp. MA1X17-3]